MFNKLFSFSRNQGVVLVTVLFLLAIGSVYFLKYIPDRQRELEEKQFRGLQNIENNISQKIDNSLALLKTLIDAYTKNASDYDSVSVRKYITDYPTKNFILSIDAPPASKLTTTASKAIDTSSVEFNNTQLIVRLTKGKTRVNITYTLKQFIAPLLSKDVFNEYIIFNDKKVIHQTFPSGITTIITDSLKNEKNGLAKWQIKDVTISGTAYKLFTQQLNLNTTTAITIAGLLTKERYDAEKNKLPERAVLFLLMIAIAGILALPWIKLYQIGNKDRLTWADGLFSFAVSMLLMSILFFAFFSYNASWQPGVAATEKSTKALSNKIKKAFYSELTNTYQILDGADKVINGMAPVNQNSKQVRALYAEQLKELTKNISVNQIFQLDKNGIEIYNWSPTTDSPPSGDFSNRAYYLNLRDNKSFYLKDTVQKKFSLEQVISWTSGSFTTVLSKRSSFNKVNPYIAIAFNLKCLNYPILPPGFLYAIINQQGLTLYHSNVSKQLNENLLSEFSEHRSLRAAIEARSDIFFTTRYAGKEYNAIVSPISGLPYYMVVLEDRAYTNIRDINNFCFSFFMLFGFFFILAAELLIVFIVSYRKIYYNKHYFDISWIGPNQRFHKQYNIAVAGNIVAIILLICIYHYTTFLQYLFILLIAATMIIYFLNYLCKKVYYEEDEPVLLELKENALISLRIIIIILNVFAAHLTAYGPVLIFQFIFIVLLAAVKKFYELAENKGWIKKATSWDFSVSFSLMTFTRLIITSGLPVVSFYIATSTYEVKLVTRYRHTEFVKSIQKDADLNLDNLKYDKIYADSVWIKTEMLRQENPKPPRAADDVITSALFKRLMIDNDELIPEIKELDHNAVDSSWIYSSLFRSGRGISYFHVQKNKYFHVESEHLKYRLPNPLDREDWFDGMVYWIGFLGFLGGFWYVLHHILRKLFALNLTSEAYWDEIDTLLLTNDGLNPLVFLIGSPGSGKLKKVKTLIEKPGINGKDGKPVIYDEAKPDLNTFFVADMILIPNDGDTEEAKNGWKKIIAEIDNEKYKLIIVNHFEYDIKNTASNSIKLNFLESLLQKNRCKLLVISTVHPVNFLDSLNQQEDDKPEGERQPEHDLERWHVLLGHFSIAIERLKNCDVSFDKDTPQWKRILLYETRNSHFLQRLREPVLTTLENKAKENKAKKGSGKIDGDSLSAKLGITSHYFYMYMWQSLTKEEKFLLYDLAEDGLVNPYDDYNLTLLISKGLIIREYNILKIFNHEFRNFILTAIGHAEAMQIQEQIKDTGNWSKLKTPLLLLIAAVLVFLFTSQKETYSTLFKYLTIIAAGVPAILKVFSMFEGKAKDA